MKSCITCGMPLEGEHAGDLGLETSEGPVCKYDAENGNIKPVEAIFAGGVAFFLEAAAVGDQTLAERLTRKNMKSLPYWQHHPSPVLEGELATDEEFATAMSKL